MNQIIENIKKRRSVRDYEAKPIPKNILMEIIEAGNNAPSGGNTQGWRFVVVENEVFRKKIAALALPRYKKWMEKAPEHLKEMRKEVDAKTSDPIYYSAPAVVFVVGSGMSTD
ncbi:MAG: nitroreductase family protein, partial [Candidatus Omnitrophota bacterium]